MTNNISTQYIDENTSSSNDLTNQIKEESDRWRTLRLEIKKEIVGKNKL